ncbi:transcription factor bHLH104-like isoform X1 [Juglans microcarpa x Juglans regia]|uniref:transcription factor bHLH104-like isoform X1 n=1 Tax=Juglans microcarpa x Juglans regia TaxID=2249226 RepID=UPI001B7DA40A|nr:transcription factor bHLH104-like isoform X1 [Juglans microcarpa x Juglans regia]
MDASLGDGSSWDFLDYSFIDDNPSPEFCLPNHGASVDIDLSSGPQRDCPERGCSRKRARNDSCSRPVSKACRERLRREKLNYRFIDLSSVLDPERTVKMDKHAILDDAIRILNQLRSESQELKATNEKLLEEIKNLKAEKNELREEKLTLKADKERMEQQLKAMAIPPAGFMPGHPAAYHSGPNKMAVWPSYGLVPMWQYLPPAARDTSHDHELRPPAA